MRQCRRRPAVSTFALGLGGRWAEHLIADPAALRVTVIGTRSLRSMPDACSRKAWLNVRRLDSSELPAAALIQLEGFYEPIRWAGPVVNGISRMVFRGEVIAALQQKLRYSTEDK